jgi:hypothetical protein
MRPGASHPEPHRSWISILAFPQLGAAGRRYWSDSAHEECHFYQYWLQNMILRIGFGESLFCNPCVGQRPSPLKEQAVEEAAMPGQPVRARARFQFPPAIHPRELPAATGVTAIIIRQALRFPRFAAPTLSHNPATRNRKTFPPCAETVDDGTSLWKPEEKAA